MLTQLGRRASDHVRKIYQLKLGQMLMGCSTARETSATSPGFNRRSSTEASSATINRWRPSTPQVASPGCWVERVPAVLTAGVEPDDRHPEGFGERSVLALRVVDGDGATAPQTAISRNKNVLAIDNGSTRLARDGRTPGVTCRLRQHDVPAVNGLLPRSY
jgi:hypothetical protein